MSHYELPLEKIVKYTLMYQQDKGQPLSYVPTDNYLQRFMQHRTDVTRFIPNQGMKKFPKSGNEGLYGWTYKNKDGAIRIRDDLMGAMKMEVDIHESIHTPDEYETRVITWWIMAGMFKRRTTYHKGVKEYFR